jgi:hypothetical protein
MFIDTYSRQIPRRRVKGAKRVVAEPHEPSGGCAGHAGSPCGPHRHAEIRCRRWPSPRPAVTWRGPSEQVRETYEEPFCRPASHGGLNLTAWDRRDFAEAVPLPRRPPGRDCVRLPRLRRQGEAGISPHRKLYGCRLHNYVSRA